MPAPAAAIPSAAGSMPRSSTVAKTAPAPAAAPAGRQEPAAAMDRSDTAASGAGQGSALAAEKIKQVIAAQTGYTPDMLENDLDLEADLGIDTVKQVEIFGKIATQFGFPVPDDLKLRDLNTIDKLAGYVAARSAPASGAALAGAGITAPPVSSTDESSASSDQVSARPAAAAAVAGAGGATSVPRGMDPAAEGMDAAGPRPGIPRTCWKPTWALTR